jgi:hypothetical protein
VIASSEEKMETVPFYREKMEVFFLGRKRKQFSLGAKMKAFPFWREDGSYFL